LDVIFADKKLEEIFSDERKLKKNFNRVSEKIKARMYEFRRATNLSEISEKPPPRRHELTGDRKGKFAVDLIHPYRLIFAPANEPLPLKADGGLDLTKTTIIKIIEVVDYH